MSNMKLFFEKENITISCLVVLGKPTLSTLYRNLKEENPSNFQIYNNKSYRKNAGCKKNAGCAYDTKQ